MASGLGMLGIAAGSTALGQGLGMINQNRQAELNKRQAKYQQGLDKEMMKYSYDLTNTTAMMRQLKNNNLNPTLAIESGSLFGRQVTQDVLKTIAETGNIEAKTLLTNKEAQNLFRRILNETIIAEAAKQNSDTNRENLANERIKAEAAKLTAEYGAGEVMNTTKVIELAAKIISSLPIPR